METIYRTDNRSFQVAAGMLHEGEHRLEHACLDACLHDGVPAGQRARTLETLRKHSAHLFLLEGTVRAGITYDESGPYDVCLNPNAVGHGNLEPLKYLREVRLHRTHPQGVDSPGVACSKLHLEL